MHQISQNIILGIVAGLTTSAILLVINVFWKKHFIPWLEERVYKDAKIEGRWYGLIRYHDDCEEKFYFDIKRKSHKIQAFMTSKDDGEIYICSGEFRNMILTLNYESKDQGQIDRGCFTFLLVNNGQKLDGNVIYYYNPNHKVDAGKSILTKQDEFDKIAEQMSPSDSQKLVSYR